MKLKLKVAPKASRNAITGWLADELKIMVTAPPEKGKANKAVIEVLAAGLDVPKQAITIVGGHTSVRKTVEIMGLDENELRLRFNQY